MEGSYFDDNISKEVIVSRMKLSMRFNPTKIIVPNPNFQYVIFNFRSQKTLFDVDGIYDIIMTHNYPRHTFPVSIPLDKLPFLGRHTISAALAEMYVNEEFQHEITREVLDFAASGARNPSFCIDVYIKVISASYLIGRGDELTWDRLKFAYENMTRPLFFVEEDVVVHDCYTLLSSSYVKVPCSYLRATHYKAEDNVMEAQHDQRQWCVEDIAMQSSLP